MQKVAKLNSAKPVKSLVLPFGLAKRRIYAGPWTQKPSHMVGVKLAREVEGLSKFFLPIHDFGVPLNIHETDIVVCGVLDLLADNHGTAPIYVGCYGGKGRTGLFLALLAKTLGVPDPVAFVRSNYFSEAVETRGQHLFVDMYESPYTMFGEWKLKAWAMLNGLEPKS